MLYQGHSKLGQSNPQTNDDGVYLLASAEGCDTPYSGPWKNSTVFIVGMGTEWETIYKRADRTDAVAHAREDGLTIDQLPARALCNDTMVTLFG